MIQDSLMHSCLQNLWSSSLDDFPKNKAGARTVDPRIKSPLPHSLNSKPLPRANYLDSVPFMTRLPKKRGITQDGEDKSLILRQITAIFLMPAR